MTRDEFMRQVSALGSDPEVRLVTAWHLYERKVAELTKALEAAQRLIVSAPPRPTPPEDAPACGSWRKTDANLAYACRLPSGHDGDHHPNACGHDGCESLRCLRGGSDGRP